MFALTKARGLGSVYAVVTFTKVRIGYIYSKSENEREILFEALDKRTDWLTNKTQRKSSLLTVRENTLESMDCGGFFHANNVPPLCEMSHIWI